MTLIPLVEIISRPFMGKGIDNSAVLTQHLGLVLAMFGSVAAERYGHLPTLGSGVGALGNPSFQKAVQVFANGSAALICGLLTLASWRFVLREMQTRHTLAYGLPVWWVQAALPLGFALLGAELGARCFKTTWLKVATGLYLPMAGFMLASHLDGTALALWPAVLWLVAMLLAGALMEIFAAIVVLVPLLLPVALSYGIDPVHFGIIFLAAMEMGVLCPPAGMNIYFASAMFGKPVRYVAAAVLPALFAVFWVRWP